ncbi:MAG: hypothetical protein ABJM19_08480 [Marinobacter sp.]|uniref:hypothetical protein n=1 Tax=Marinobacter sp. TaxID=50741 RepID=UPI00329A065D
MIALQFPAILVEHGFTPVTYDFDSTILGFRHDIYNALIHRSPVFSEDSKITSHRFSPGAFLQVQLMTHAAGSDLDSALSYFFRQWFAELRYQLPVCEIFEVRRNALTADIHALSINEHNAMTFRFSIQRGAYEPL